MPALSLPGAAFLDRDGTINVKAGPGKRYVENPDELRLLPGAATAIRRLNDAGLPVLVVTNQRGIALGRLDHDDLASIHERLNELLERESDARVDDFFYCPHDLDSCDCRKPEIGLFLQAQERQPEIDLSASAIVGDSAADVAAGRRMDMRTIRLGADVPDLPAAVARLLE